MQICETPIRQSGDLYSFNDLHQASGGEERHQPAFFLRTEQARALIAELAKSANLQICTQTKRGANGGTYACRELVIAYAAWISPAFHLKVIRVFLQAQAAQSPQTPDTSLGQKSLGWAAPEPMPTFRRRRFLVSIDDEGREHIQPVPDDATVASRADWPRLIRDPDFFHQFDELREIVVAGFDRMAAMQAASQSAARILRRAR